MEVTLSSLGVLSEGQVQEVALTLAEPDVVGRALFFLEYVLDGRGYLDPSPEPRVDLKAYAHLMLYLGTRQFQGQFARQAELEKLNQYIARVGASLPAT